MRTRVVKNKVAPPFRQAEFDMIFSGKKMGISREGDIIDLGADMGIVKRQGSFYSYGELRLGQGRENARNFLIDNPALAQEIEGLIRAAAAAIPTYTAPTNGARGTPIASDDAEDEPEA